MPLRLDSAQLRELLPEEDALIIEQMIQYLQVMADIAQADVFIDCPLPGQDSALVIAQAQPATAKSLYKGSVIGQKALLDNEPGVFYTFQTGRPLIGSRAISQEHVTMQQNITPILNPDGLTIGILIMEQDITEKVRKEQDVEMLIEAAENLSETLLQISMSDTNVPDLINEGIIIFNRSKGVLTYTNTKALSMLQRIGFGQPREHIHVDELGFGPISQELYELGGMIQKEYQFRNLSLQIKLVSIFSGQKVIGGIMLLRDISDIKEKEKQLIVQSAVIQEIHHRVKNNLQTISSLLRLQMRRSPSPEVERTFLESINRINSISIIHEILAQYGIDTINCKDVLRRIIKTIQGSFTYSGQQLNIQLESDDMYLPSSKATSLALVVNELIQNCVDHAFYNRDAGHILIVIKVEQPVVLLTITDNGVGIGMNRLSAEGGHLGLQIVETLVREDLNGTFELIDSGQGTEARILFPIDQEE
ncbi:MAG: sensor histidine kinase [Paenibacillaceae bacterium]